MEGAPQPGAQPNHFAAFKTQQRGAHAKRAPPPLFGVFASTRWFGWEPGCGLGRAQPGPAQPREPWLFPHILLTLAPPYLIGCCHSKGKDYGLQVHLVRMCTGETVRAPDGLEISPTASMLYLDCPCGRNVWLRAQSENRHGQCAVQGPRSGVEKLVNDNRAQAVSIRRLGC